MSKSMVISLAATVIFAVVYITDCCVDAKEAKEETPIITEIPHIEELNEQVVPTGDGKLVVLNSDSEIEHGRVEVIEVKRKPTPRLIEVKATEIEEEATEETTEEEQPSMTYLGVYELTAYEWTGSPCANGNYPTLNYTIASNTIPMGSRVYIEGLGDYVVEDRGGMAGNVIDVYMGDYWTCIQFGRQTANVYIYD